MKRKNVWKEYARFILWLDRVESDWNWRFFWTEVYVGLDRLCAPPAAP